MGLRSNDLMTINVGCEFRDRGYLDWMGGLYTPTQAVIGQVAFTLLQIPRPGFIFQRVSDHGMH